METTYENAALAGGNQIQNVAQLQHDTTSRLNPGGAGILASRITASVPERLTKRYELGQGGQLDRQKGGELVEGTVERLDVRDLHDLLATLGDLSCAQAMTYGIVPDHPSARLVTAAKHREGDGCVTRTRKYFGYRRAPGIMMLDHDATSAEYTPEGLIAATRSIAPSLATAPFAWRASASSGIVTMDGEKLTGLTGQRLYLLVSDAALIPEAGQALVNLCWAQGLGRIEVGRAGQALERTLFDAMVWQPERLDFAAGPDLGPGLMRVVPDPFVDGDPRARFDLRQLIADADQGVLSRATTARKKARTEMTDALATARGAWLDEQAPRLAEKRGISDDEARAVLDAASSRQSLPVDFVLYTSDDREVTVRELLDHPEHWHGKRFADPLEPDYHEDNRIAWANLRSGGQPYLYSHAHGGRRFELIRPSRRIQLRDGERARVVDEALELLQERGELFEFGDALARISSDVTPSACVVKDFWLMDHLDRVSDFYTVKAGEEEERPANAPPYVAQRILVKNGERGLPKLEAVITAPTLRSDGSLLNEPGYDHGSKLLLAATTPELAHIPSAPTLEQAKAALDVLWSPFRLFPLVDAIDRGVVLAAVLTATARASLPTAPGFGFDAPAAGSGKTLLAQAIGALSLGAKPQALPPVGNQDDEARKRLFAALRDGVKVMLWDNIRDPLGNAALDAFLTADIFSDRVLGVSETKSLPNRALFLTTGNQLRLVGDTCRRILVARIDPRVERPYAREFDFCPVESVLSRRQELVGAALTLMRGYITAGRHRLGQGRTASFETWDDLVRQTVCWVAFWDDRFEDPLKATERAYEEDPDTANLRNLLHAWNAVHGTKPVTVEGLLKNGQAVYSGSDAQREAHADLHDAIDAVAGDHRGINNRILGKWIAKHKNRRVDGLRIVSASAETKSRKAKQWQLAVDAGAEAGAELPQTAGVWGFGGVISSPLEISRTTRIAPMPSCPRLNPNMHVSTVQPTRLSGIDKGVSMMETHTLTIPFNGGEVSGIIQAEKSLKHYLRHYPRIAHLQMLHRERKHAMDTLSILKRVISVMDTYNLISCTHRQCSLLALSLGRLPTASERKMTALPGNHGAGWDHVSYWRRPGARAPCVVITEPYHLSRKTIERYDVLADRLDLDYHIGNDNALWNPPHSTAVLWHRRGDRLKVEQVNAKAA
jgi:hypothetical protein